MYRVLLYKSPYTPKPKSNQKTVPKTISENLDLSLEFSIRRTRRVLHDYVKCNNFDLFVTFTFNPKKINRYDINSVFPKMQSWLWRQHQKDKNFKYVIVPEKHKDGAIHFHALMSNYPFDLKKTNVIQNSRRVYNITAFRFGFTNATLLPSEDKEKAANYIAKYITKDMITLSNKRRYWCSRNLQRPKKHYNAIFDLNLSNHLDHKSMIHETDFNVMYDVPKDLFA